MDGGDEAVFNREMLVKDLGDRCERIGRTGGVGENDVFGGIEKFVIDAVDESSVDAFSWSGDHDTLGSGGEVIHRFFFFSECTGGFEDEVHI